MMRTIPGYETYMINENGVVINKNGHVLRPALSNTGRARVALEVYDENGKLLHRDNRSIHRLVAQTFIPNPNNLPVVMHLDNDTLHNHVLNLKWGTQSDNMRQAYDEGRKTSNFTHDPYIFEVYNENESIKCKGRQGVADLIGIQSKSVVLGPVKSGQYKGYEIRNTGQKLIRPFKIIKNN